MGNIPVLKPNEVIAILITPYYIALLHYKLFP